MNYIYKKHTPILLVVRNHAEIVKKSTDYMSKIECFTRRRSQRVLYKNDLEEIGQLLFASV